MPKGAQILEVKDKNSGNIRKLDIDKLDRRPMADYYELDGRIINVENHVYYDMAIYQGGLVIKPENTADLFVHGKTQSVVCTNDPASRLEKKGELFTNMVTDGEFDNSTSFLLEMISVDLIICSEPATWAMGNTLSASNVPVAGHTAAGMFKAISRQFKLSFFRSEQEMVSGLLYEFPCPFTATGAFGASLGGFVQNGYGGPTWNKLSEIHALKSNDRFSMQITPLSQFTPTIPFEIRVLMIGKRIQTFQA